ncbi:MAG: hypothetical protein RL235_628, partial [Chlamydiota bacterium]
MGLRQFSLTLFAHFSALSLLCADPTPEEIVAIHDDIKQEEIALFDRKGKSESTSSNSSGGYTINYNTVSILEYLRFASKICNTNFIFNEDELDFTVTVVSDAPITPQNVMATLVQVLRIHGMLLLEQDNNLVIHKSEDVKQIAKLVTGEGSAGGAAIVTRIFRVKNAKPESIAAIIRPMISNSALLETSPETRQIILSDVTANVDKVANLIEILDSPHSPLEIKRYEAKHNRPDLLVNLATQIMAPLAQGNPLLMVPQDLANTIFIVTTTDLGDKTLDVLETLDTVPKRELMSQRRLKAENIFVYAAEHKSGDDLLRHLRVMVDNLQKSGILEGDLAPTIEGARYVKQTNSIMFFGSKESLDKVRELLATLDVPTGEELEKGSFFVYRPLHRSAQDLEISILEMAANLKGTKGEDAGLIHSIESVRINNSTQTLVFSGDEATFGKVKELLSTIDTASDKAHAKGGKHNFYVYKAQHATPVQIDASLKMFAKDLDHTSAADEGLIQTINKAKVMPETRSILFTGPESALKRLQEIVPSFDSGIALTPATDQFFIYKPKMRKGEDLAKAITEVSDNLKDDQFADPAFLKTLQSMKWVKSSNSLFFTGNQASIKRLEDLIASLDVQTGARIEEKNFLLYHPQHASKEKIEQYLKQISDNLQRKEGDDLGATIRSMKWIEASQSFMFHGTKESIAKVKELLTNFDTPAEARTTIKPGYYIYKLEHASGETIEDDLDQLAKNLKTSGAADPSLLQVIDSMRYVKETNSLLLTGDPKAIEEVKKMIAIYDHPREVQTGPMKSNFFMYKPQHVPASAIEKSLRDVGASLKKADLADPSLLTAIDSARYVEATNSLIFTGSPETLQKIQTLIKDIDVVDTKHAPIQQIGKTTFLLYKLKAANGPQIIASIKAMTSDLKKSGESDKNFIAALQSVKYVKETNSLLFTGKEEALKKVEGFVAQFDVSSLGAPTARPTPELGSATNFIVYKPQSLPGLELEKIMLDFAENLKLGGLADPDLFNAIHSIRWIDKTQSLMFTGTPKALEQIKQLLTLFDIPSNITTDPLAGGPQEPSIQAIDNTSFLVYKLQFHKGDEIQGALKQIAKDLILSNAPVNQNLLNSINSIQWLEVTNSLLCSGDQETLTRLRELIKNLDVPLKQVFIEMLVIETNLTNALNFGLEWGGKYKYRDKFAGSFNNIAANADGSGTIDSMMTALNAFVPSA